MNTSKSVMLRLSNFSDDNKKLLKDVARDKRMSVGSYVATVLEKEIKKEAKKIERSKRLHIEEVNSVCNGSESSRSVVQ